MGKFGDFNFYLGSSTNHGNRLRRGQRALFDERVENCFGQQQRCLAVGIRLSKI